MISRKTTLALGEAYQAVFSYETQEDWRGPTTYEVDSGHLYDFLYANNFTVEFCNYMRNRVSTIPSSKNQNRVLKDIIISIETGEFFNFLNNFPTSDYERVKQGIQILLTDLSKAFLNHVNAQAQETKKDKILTKTQTLLRALELDGYIYREPDLLRPEQDVINVEEEHRTLHILYQRLNLDDKEQAFKFLDLSEEHYIAGRWEDAIGNARKFFEQVLREVSNTHSIKSIQQPLAKNVYEKPVEVRIYLEKSGLMETKEVEAIKGIYGLLSETGGHPKTAKNDQARLLRHLALTLSQFAMLRLEGFLKP